eukprot:scaffold12747_cov78-Skeletonema_dohrnii-CCMP3373.AAC.2
MLEETGDTCRIIWQGKISRKEGRETREAREAREAHAQAELSAAYSTIQVQYSGILNEAKDEQKHVVLPMRQYLDDLHLLGRWQKESSVISRSEQIPIE